MRVSGSAFTDKEMKESSWLPLYLHRAESSSFTQENAVWCHLAKNKLFSWNTTEYCTCVDEYVCVGVVLVAFLTIHRAVSLCREQLTSAITCLEQQDAKYIILSSSNTTTLNLFRHYPEELHIRTKMSESVGQLIIQSLPWQLAQDRNLCNVWLRPCVNRAGQPASGRVDDICNMWLVRNQRNIRGWRRRLIYRATLLKMSANVRDKLRFPQHSFSSFSCLLPAPPRHHPSTKLSVYFQ